MLHVEATSAQSPLKSLSLVWNETESMRLNSIAETRTVPKNGYIYKAGEPAKCLYFIKQGRVKITTRSPEGKELIKAILHNDDMLGELCLAGETIHTDSAKAINQEAKIQVIPFDALLKLLSEQPELSLKVILQLGSRLDYSNRRFESLVFQDARTRIVEFLKDSANTMGIKVGYEVLLKQFLTHQDIANITATSRQTVTTVLNDLKKQNLIYIYRKNILIRDISKLK